MQAGDFHTVLSQVMTFSYPLTLSSNPNRGMNIRGECMILSLQRSGRKIFCLSKPTPQNCLKLLDTIADIAEWQEHHFVKWQMKDSVLVFQKCAHTLWWESALNWFVEALEAGLLCLCSDPLAAYPCPGGDQARSSAVRCPCIWNCEDCLCKHI